MSWFADTLAKRLFLLMWVTLVGSHVLAYLAVQRLTLSPGGGDGPGPVWPTFPSLPPTPGVPGTSPLVTGPPRHGPPPDGPPAAPDHRPPPSDGPPPRDVDEVPSTTRPPEHRPGPVLPWPALLLDYGVRLVFIGAAAAFGARWLAAPVRRLVGASRVLGDSIGTPTGPVPLDDRHGTREVREAAAVFNAMARQLHSQFASRGLMVAAISHDLRTPLRRLRLRLETMAATPEQRQRSAADIGEMDALIDTTLELFRGTDSTEPLQSTDITALVEALVDDLVEQRRPVAFGPSDAVVAPARSAALRRVLHNLVGNALRYGGRADVRVLREPAQLSIVVDDDGPGIAPELLEAVFQPFFRIDTSRNRDSGGTGLGLYIARDLIERQGGRVTLANRPEGGLRARAVLPLR